MSILYTNLKQNCQPSKVAEYLSCGGVRSEIEQVYYRLDKQYEPPVQTFQVYILNSWYYYWK
jgi:hypothetical protein